MSETRLINEVFYSIQGEGVRAGTANVFVRFAKCNMECRVEPGPRSPGGFDCDTEFESGRRLTLPQVEEWVEQTVDVEGWAEPWMILTGGEPALQLDRAFCDYFHERGWSIAVETNGSTLLPLDVSVARPEEAWERLVRDHGEAEALERMLRCFCVDWITVSPKVAEHAIRQRWAHEVKYVRGHGQAVPQTRVRALHHLVSPAFDGLDVDHAAVDWCAKLVRENPRWRMTAQLHKLWVQR